MTYIFEKIANLLVFKVKNKLNYTPGFIILGFLILLFSWIIGLVFMKVNVSFEGLAQLHKQAPIYYAVDLAPLLLGLLGFILSKYYQETTSELLEIIEEKDQIINQNAQLAKKIGEGDLSAVEEIIDEKDVLGKSLMIMRENLSRTNENERQQNWIAKGKDTISDILRMHNDLEELSYKTLVELIKYINVLQGAFYLYSEEEGKLINSASFAYNRRKYQNIEFKVGEGLVGQCAFEMATIFRREIPEEYVSITSGILGNKKPSSLLLVPLITDDKLQGVIEFASLDKDIDKLSVRFLEELSDIIARTIFNLKVNSRTEKLLKDAQEMTNELQENEEELRQNAEEMRATHEELEKSNVKLESQILEVENAQKRLHSLLENASEIISIYDDDMKLKYISPSVASIYGYSGEEMMDGKDLDRLTARGVKEFTEMFSTLAEKPEQAKSIQYTYMRKDGQKIFIESKGRNLLDDPAIDGIIINSQDITERKRAEKEERMKSKMQSLSENSPDMILRLSPTGQFFYANPIVKIFTGVNNNDIIKKNLSDVDFHADIKQFFLDSIKKVKSSQQKTNTETTFPTNFGARIMQVNAIPEFSDDKELETILFVAHDITEQKKIEEEIKEKNRAVEESINYAQRIQSSILPHTKYIQEFLPKSFIYYKPKDVVSGDFPWFFKKGDDLFIAAVDCTGHGVPGALLSFIGYFILNNVVDHYENINAGEVLDKLHEGVRTTLKQDRIDSDARDGMDIALCKINLKNNLLEYSGAHRPLYLFRNGELNEYKGNRKAIGGIPHGKKSEKDFENYIINLEIGDKVFFFSDGLPDQINADRKKYQAKRVREGILNNKDMKISDFEKYFSDDFEAWRGEYKQIDDVLLIGIEF
ncbi:MAG: PAS domain S-box protein [Salinivirgaceae bacterium]|nr:PAS domain S-box protein [Salinivirgaceae bacterium]